MKKNKRDVFLCGLMIIWLTGCGLLVKTIPLGQIVSTTPQDHFIAVDGTNYHYTEYPAAGQNVFLLHGFASSTYTWDEIAPILHSQGYHVWALDMKGFGWSDKPYDSSYDPITLMEEVNTWMDAVGLTDVVFAGNSLGGAIAVLMAIEHPERVGRMVLIDAAGYPMKKPFIIKLAKIPFSGTTMQLTFGRWLVRMNLKEVFYDDEKVTRERVDAYYDRLRSENSLEAQVSLAKSLDFDSFGKYTCRIPGIQKHTLIIWGENDKWIPLEIGQRFKHDLPNATLKVIPSCGHIPQEEYPEITAEVLLNFLSETR